MEEESCSQIGVKGGVGGGVGRLVLVDVWSWVICLLCCVLGVVECVGFVGVWGGVWGCLLVGVDVYCG